MGGCFSPRISCKHRLTLDLIKINNLEARSLDWIPPPVASSILPDAAYDSDGAMKTSWWMPAHRACTVDLCGSLWCNLWWDGQHQRFLTKEAMAGPPWTGLSHMCHPSSCISHG
jgi:hypothetical protein